MLWLYPLRYFDGNLFTSFRGGLHYDGGLTDLIPVPLGVDEAVKAIKRPFSNYRLPGHYVPLS